MASLVVQWFPRFLRSGLFLVVSSVKMSFRTKNLSCFLNIFLNIYIFFNPLKPKSKKKMREGPRLPKYHAVGLSKEETERAHRPGRFDMSAGEGPSDSGSLTEKGHQVEPVKKKMNGWRI